MKMSCNANFPSSSSSSSSSVSAGSTFAGIFPATVYVHIASGGFLLCVLSDLLSEILMAPEAGSQSVANERKLNRKGRVGE